MVMQPPQEYLDYLKKNLDEIEQAVDKLTGTDERIDFAVSQLHLIIEQLGTFNWSLIKDLNLLLAEMQKVGFMAKRTEQIRFQQTLAVQQGVRVTEVVPMDGILTSATMHFPPGCLSFVDIAVGYKTRQFLPIEGFIALDDTTPVFPISEVVQKNEAIWVIMQNGDTLNTHTVSVILTLVGEEQ